MMDLQTRLKRISSIAIVILLGLIPTGLFKINFYSAILPSLDICIVIYLISMGRLRYWHLFVLGILIDQLTGYKIGSTSSALLLIAFGLGYVKESTNIRDFSLNICIFPGTLFVISTMRFISTYIWWGQGVDAFTMFFNFFSTSFCYPIIYVLLDRLLHLNNPAEYHHA